MDGTLRHDGGGRLARLEDAGPHHPRHDPVLCAAGAEPRLVAAVLRRALAGPRADRGGVPVERGAPHHARLLRAADHGGLALRTLSRLGELRRRAERGHLVAERLINESSRNAKDLLEGAESKARSILSGAEARGRKYISTAESEAQDIVSEATREAEAVIDTKRREAAALASAARREGERIVADAANEVIEYRRWLAEVLAESERLYRLQTQALVAAEQAIVQSRQRLDGAFARLANMQDVVNDSLNEDGTVRHKEPIKVESRRAAPAIDAPSRRAPKKSAAKKTPSKRK